MEGTIAVPGGRVWFQRIGGGPGRPLLVVHGGRACRTTTWPHCDGCLMSGRSSSGTSSVAEIPHVRQT